MDDAAGEFLAWHTVPRRLSRRRAFLLLDTGATEPVARCGPRGARLARPAQAKRPSREARDGRFSVRQDTGEDFLKP